MFYDSRTNKLWKRKVLKTFSINVRHSQQHLFTKIIIAFPILLHKNSTFWVDLLFSNTVHIFLYLFWSASSSLTLERKSYTKNVLGYNMYVYSVCGWIQADRTDRRQMDNPWLELGFPTKGKERKSKIAPGLDQTYNEVKLKIEQERMSGKFSRASHQNFKQHPNSTFSLDCCSYPVVFWFFKSKEIRQETDHKEKKDRNWERIRKHEWTLYSQNKGKTNTVWIFDSFFEHWPVNLV